MSLKGINRNLKVSAKNVSAKLAKSHSFTDFISNCEDPKLPAPEPYVYDPNKPKQKEIVLDRHEETIQYTDHDGRFQMKKYALFTICFFSNICGLVVTLYSLSMTVLFDQYGVNETVFWISLIFYLPCLVWLRYICCPLGKERQHRRNVIWHRRLRDHFSRVRHNYYHGNENEEADDDIENQRHADESNRRASLRQSYKKKISFHGDAVAGNSARNSNSNLNSPSIKPSIKASIKAGSSKSARVEPASGMSPAIATPAALGPAFASSKKVSFVVGPPREPTGVLIGSPAVLGRGTAGDVKRSTGRNGSARAAVLNSGSSSNKNVQLSDNALKLQSLKSKRVS